MKQTGIVKNIKAEKPPLGLMPKKIWLELRLQDVVQALERYTSCSKEIPTEWVKEYNELVTTLRGE